MSSLALSILQRKPVERETFIHRLDARVKFVFFLWISIWAYIFLDYVVTLIFLAGVMVLNLLGRNFSRTMKAVSIIIVPWIAVASLILGAYFPWNKTLLVKFEGILFGYDYALYYEGIAWSVTWPLRIGVCIASAMFFLFTTDPVKLIALLFKLRVPFRFIYGIAGGLQLTPILLNDLHTIMEAQKSRGLRTDVSIMKRALHYLALIVPLTLSTLNKVQIRATALEARGFSAPVQKTWPYDLSLKRRDYAFIAGMIIMTAVFAFIYIFYGFSPICRLEFYILGYGG